MRWTCADLPPRTEFQLHWRSDGRGSPETHLVAQAVTDTSGNLVLTLPDALPVPFATHWGQLFSLFWTLSPSGSPSEFREIFPSGQPPAWNDPQPPAHRNPFRTSRTHALPFLPPAPELAPDILAENFLRSGPSAHLALLGSHGHGKSTLLREIGAALAARGHPVHPLRLDGPHALSPVRNLLSVAPLRPPVILLADGLEQLPLPLRALFLAWLRHRGVRLLGTVHIPGILPALAVHRTTPDLLHQLVARLLPPSAFTSDLAAALPGLHAWHGGDLRDCFLDLYDQCASGAVYVEFSEFSEKTSPLGRVPP